MNSDNNSFDNNIAENPNSYINQTRQIDLNAHIENIQHEITPYSENEVQLKITFCNKYYGVITAIKFKAIAYNAFNDIVKVDGNDVFPIIFQNLRIEKNTLSLPLITHIKNSQIQKIHLVEDQVRFSDGKICTYQGPNPYKIHLKQFNKDDPYGAAVLKGMKYKYGAYAEYLPQQLGDKWICCCGNLNDNTAEECPKCNNHKKDVDLLTYSAFRNQLISTGKSLEENTAKTERNKKRKKIFTVAAIVILAAIVAPISIRTISKYLRLQNCETYSSEDSAIDHITGEYVQYSTSGDDIEAIYFITSKDDVKKYLPPLSSVDEPTIKNYKINNLDYKRGTFSITNDSDSSSDYIYDINKDQNLEMRRKKTGQVFETYEFVEDADDSAYESDYNFCIKGLDDENSMYNEYETIKLSHNIMLGLNFTIENAESDYTMSSCNGTISNEGDNTYKSITVECEFEDEYGDIIYSSSSEIIHPPYSTQLAPGEQLPFAFVVSTEPEDDIEQVELHVIDYELK